MNKKNTTQAEKKEMNNLVFKGDFMKKLNDNPVLTDEVKAQLKQLGQSFKATY